MTATVGIPSNERTNLAKIHPSGNSSRRTRQATDESLSGARFFLARAGTNGDTLELGREFSNEGEARVEALKSGVTYYSLQEWRPVADFAGRNPELKREPVVRKGANHVSE